MLFSGIKKRLHYVSVLLISLLGIALSATAFVVVSSQDRLKMHIDFEESAEEMFGVLEKELEADLQILESIKAFYIGSEKVERPEFHDFTKFFFKKHPSIQALEWIPRVPYSKRGLYEKAAGEEGFPGFQISERMTQGRMKSAGRREEYYPVYFVEPYKGNEIALGFDLASCPQRKESLERSRDTGEQVATGRITLVQETAGQFGFLVFEPIYREKAPTGSVEERRRNIEGFVLGVFRIGDIVEKSLKHHKPKGIDISLYDMSASEGERLLYSHTLHPHNGTDSPVDYKINNPGKGFEYARPLNVGGRKWQVLFTPTREYVAARKSLQSWGFLILGLLSTGLVVSYVVFRIKHSAELSDTNEHLRHAVTEREKAEQELEMALRTALEEKTKTEAVIAGIGDGISIQDRNFRIMYQNQVLKELVGEHIGEYCYLEYEHREDVCEGCPVAMSFSDGGIHKVERSAPTDRGIIYVEVTTSPLRNADGEIIAGIETVRDITERKQAEGRMSFLASIIQNVPDAVCSIERGGKITSWNAGAEQMLGYKETEILGKPITTILPEEIADNEIEHCTRILDVGGILSGYESIRVTRNGERIPVEITGMAVQLMGHVGYAFIMRNITERKRAEGVMRLQGEIARNISEGIYLVGAKDLRIIYANPKMETMFGYDPGLRRTS